MSSFPDESSNSDLIVSNLPPSSGFRPGKRTAFAIGIARLPQTVRGKIFSILQSHYWPYPLKRSPRPNQRLSSSTDREDAERCEELFSAEETAVWLYVLPALSPSKALEFYKSIRLEFTAFKPSDPRLYPYGVRDLAILLRPVPDEILGALTFIRIILSTRDLKCQMYKQGLCQVFERFAALEPKRNLLHVKISLRPERGLDNVWGGSRFKTIPCYVEGFPGCTIILNIWDCDNPIAAANLHGPEPKVTDIEVAVAEFNDLLKEERQHLPRVNPLECLPKELRDQVLRYLAATPYKTNSKRWGCTRLHQPTWLQLSQVNRQVRAEVLYMMSAQTLRFLALGGLQKFIAFLSFDCDSLPIAHKLSKESCAQKDIHDILGIERDYGDADSPQTAALRCVGIEMQQALRASLQTRAVTSARGYRDCYLRDQMKSFILSNDGRLVTMEQEMLLQAEIGKLCVHFIGMQL